MVTFWWEIFGNSNVVTHKVKVKTAQVAFLLSPTGRWLLVRKGFTHHIFDFHNDWRMTVELNLSYCVSAELS